MHSVSEYIFISILIAALGFVAYQLSKLTTLSDVLGIIAEWITKPVRKLLKWIGSLISPHYQKVAGKLLPFDWVQNMGGAGMALSFFAALLFVILSFVFCAIQSGSISAVAEILFYNTMLGALLSMISTGFATSVPLLIAAGLCSFITDLIMKKVESKLDGTGKIIWLSWIYNIIFLFASCILCSYFEDLINLLVQAGIDLYNQLIDASHHQSASAFLSVLKSIGYGLVLVVLVYLGGSFLIITINEILATLVYGSWGVVALFGVGQLTIWICDWLSISFLSTWLTALVAIGAIVYAEQKRSSHSP
jgi:hypothetical protein